MRSQIRGTNSWVMQQLLPAAFQRDVASFQHISAVGNGQGLVGHLLHKQDGQTTVSQCTDRFENLGNDQGRQTQRGLVQQQQLGLAHECA